MSAMPSTLTFVDVETTGLDPERHEIVEIGLVLANAATLEEIGAFSARVAPERLEDADPGALVVNGFTAEAWAGALPLRSALELALPMLAGSMLAGHNVGFDRSFLSAAFQRAGMPMPAYKYSLDTASMAWPLLRSGRIPRLSLDALAAYFGLTRESPHRALADARCALEVARRLSEVTR